MTNDEFRRNDEIRMTKPATAQLTVFDIRASGLISHWSFNDLCKSGSWSPMHGKRFGSGCSTINAPRHAGLCDHDFTERWQRRLQTFPDPHGDVFAGRVVQAANFVEV